MNNIEGLLEAVINYSKINNVKILVYALNVLKLKEEYCDILIGIKSNDYLLENKLKNFLENNKFDTHNIVIFSYVNKEDDNGTWSINISHLYNKIFST